MVLIVRSHLVCHECFYCLLMYNELNIGSHLNYFMSDTLNNGIHFFLNHSQSHYLVIKIAPCFFSELLIIHCRNPISEEHLRMRSPSFTEHIFEVDWIMRCNFSKSDAEFTQIEVVKPIKTAERICKKPFSSWICFCALSSLHSGSHFTT